ncbi:factor-independent urate hydroxylase [Streptomyces telluris]|uniref:Uricase n=1 Tax=Streptomyces telluris TaxID=2720021 RepID=A0A9X2RPQ7_9ACTN|nr:urate oxidase [Streptomyces telluris]MCQ8774207.1 urate oxidase [Streptomyces telluris]NJP77582.1 urate oxidase [Streptomyces telluris]
MPTVLGQNQYGKAETRVVRVTRDGPVHHIRDLNVSIALSGAMDDVHLSGSNARVLPTDTTKNTVFAFAKEYGVASPEGFAARLAHHFVTGQEAIGTARVRVEEYAWDRIPTPGPAGHSFVRSGRETRTAQVTFDGAGGRWQVLSGLKGLTVMNTTDSEFHGYVKDRYTTLPETRDRILATEVNACWRHAWDGGGEEDKDEWDEAFERTRGHLLGAFAETYSFSLQQTLYAMGSRVIEQTPGIDEIRLSLPNKHHFLADLAPFGLANDNEVYYTADRPYGLIEATVLREGATAAVPVDLTNLP